MGTLAFIQGSHVLLSFKGSSRTGPAALAVRGDIGNWLENIPALGRAEGLEPDLKIPVGSFQLGIHSLSMREPFALLQFLIFWESCSICCFEGVNFLLVLLISTAVCSSLLASLLELLSCHLQPSSIRIKLWTLQIEAIFSTDDVIKAVKYP